MQISLDLTEESKIYFFFICPSQCPTLQFIICILLLLVPFYFILA